MARLLTSALLLALAGIKAVSADLPDFSGSGEIYVINSTDVSTASMDDSIGCLDATGALSVDDCGIYTILSVYPYTLSSTVGNCTFSNASQPANTDSAYGDDSYAWYCSEDYVGTVNDEFYTVNGFSKAFLCHGDINCYYDVPSAPTDNSTVSVWEYIWGTQQTSITPGHLEVMWLWNSTSS